MKYGLQIYVLLMTILLLASCGDDPFSVAIDADPPPYEKQLVVHCYITSTGKDVVATLSESKPLFDQDYSFNGVAGELSLYQDGVKLFDFEQIDSSQDYIYSSDEVFGLRGGEFELRAVAPGYPEISATQKFPPHVPIKEVAFKKNSYINNVGVMIDKFEITFDDPVDEENFYEVSVVSIDSTCHDDHEWDVKYIETRDYNAGKGGSFNIITMSDEAFNGKSYTLVFGANEVLSNGHNLQISWKCITKEQYLYSKSLQDFSVQEEFGSVGDPVPLFSNVEGGVGFFGCAAHKTYLLTDFCDLYADVISLQIEGEEMNPCHVHCNQNGPQFNLNASFNVSLDTRISLRINFEELNGAAVGEVIMNRQSNGQSGSYSAIDVPINITEIDEQLNVISGNLSATLFDAENENSITIEALSFSVNL